MATTPCSQWKGEYDICDILKILNQQYHSQIAESRMIWLLS